jgi:hypothetical protein
MIFGPGLRSLFSGVVFHRWYGHRPEAVSMAVGTMGGEVPRQLVVTLLLEGINVSACMPRDT